MLRPDGQRMFEDVEVARGNAKRAGFLKVGERIVRMLRSGTSRHPNLQTLPSAQPSDISNVAGWQQLRIHSGSITPEVNYRIAGSIAGVLYNKCDKARVQDAVAMKASCNNVDCPTCRLPEEQQPDEEDIFFDDVIYWWNVCRGKCMGAGCRRKLCFYRSPAEMAAMKARKEKPKADLWTLQRENNKKNHVPSNIIGVLCQQCNATINAKPP